MRAAGIDLAGDAFTPLSEAMEVWHFDMLSPPEESHRKALDVTFTRYTQTRMLELVVLQLLTTRGVSRFSCACTPICVS